MPDTYIEECVRSGHKVRLYTTNGFQIVGTLVHEDSDTVVIHADGRNKLVFKRAISTIEPFEKPKNS